MLKIKNKFTKFAKAPGKVKAVYRQMTKWMDILSKHIYSNQLAKNTVLM